MANNVEKPIVVESPSTVNSEQLNVYVPVASTNKKGIAKFDSRYFNVDADGKVAISNIPGQFISSIEYWNHSNELVLWYNDNTYTKVPYPVIKEDVTDVIRYGALSVVTFSKDSWIKHTIEDAEHPEHYSLILTPERLGVTNCDYAVFAEDLLVEKVVDNDVSDVHLENHWLDERAERGYVTTEASYFKVLKGKGDDENTLPEGTLIYTIESEPYAGRLLILGGYLFDEKIIDVRMDEKGNIEVEYTNGDKKSFTLPLEKIEKKADKYEFFDKDNTTAIQSDMDLRGLTIRIFDTLDESISRLIVFENGFYIGTSLFGPGVGLCSSEGELVETFWQYGGIVQDVYTFPDEDDWIVESVQGTFYEPYPIQLLEKRIVDCEYNYKTKADKYEAATEIAVGVDLSGKAITFDTSIDLSNYTSEYGYGTILLKSSGGYTFSCESMPEIALFKGTATHPPSSGYTRIKTFWTYEGWEADANQPYKLPDDFGTITETNTIVTYPINELATGETFVVDCEYNYKEVQKIQKSKLYRHRAIVNFGGDYASIIFYSARSTPYTSTYEMYSKEGEKLFSGIYLSQNSRIALCVHGTDVDNKQVSVWCLNISDSSLSSITATLSMDEIVSFE